MLVVELSAVAIGVGIFLVVLGISHKLDQEA
jgi:hypothetical protein